MIAGKKILLSALAATLALGATACGDSDSSAEGKESPAAGASSAAPAASTAPVTINLMGNYDKPELSETDKKFIAEIEQMNNVKLNFEIPPATGYNERLQLMLASGTYPDVVFFPNTTDQSFQNAVKDGIIKPVNEYLKKAPNLQKYTYQASWDQLKVNQDDKIYGIPRTSVIRNDAFWVRKDWLDNIGFAVPKDNEVTLAQFEEILKKFTTDDPDKNGKKDTYGYVGAYNAQKVLDVIAPGAFGLTGWQKASGGNYEYMNAIYDQSGSKFKNALAFSAKMYTSGYFDPDSATNDEAKQRERFWRGLAGVMPGFAGHYGWHLGEIKKNTPTAELTYLFVKDDEGKVKGGTLTTSPTGVWGFWAITTSAKNPQKVVDVLDSYISDKMWNTTSSGYEGVDYTVEGSVKTPIKGMTSYVRKNTMRRANDINFFFSVDTKEEVKTLVTPWLQKSLETVIPAKDVGFLPDAGKKPNFMDYKKVWEQTVMKIIMGSEPVTKFDELLAGWYKNGGEDYVKEMNAYIKKMESAK